MEKQCEFIVGQLNLTSETQDGEITELSEDELEKVAGGGLFDWFNGLSSTWKGVVIGVAVGAVVP